MGRLTAIQQESKMRVGFQKTITVMSSEVGDLAKSILYGHLDEQMDIAHRAEAKIALSDLITQCRVMAELPCTPFEELMTIGEDRFTERARECKSGIR